MLQTSMTGSRKVVCVLVNEKSEDLIFIKELIEAGKSRNSSPHISFSRYCMKKAS
jgi:hypothetical protein